jgi:hypothetical protein
MDEWSRSGVQTDGWMAFRSYLGTGRMEVFDAELWAIGIALHQTVKKSETLQTHGVTMMAIFSDSQAAIRRAAHLELGPGQQLAMGINRRARHRSQDSLGPWTCRNPRKRGSRPLGEQSS